MLKGINQADTRLISPIQHYGCYFLTLAEASPIIFKEDEGCQRLNGIWVKATELGIISGDINHDGDVDDDNDLATREIMAENGTDDPEVLTVWRFAYGYSLAILEEVPSAVSVATLPEYRRPE